MNAEGVEERETCYVVVCTINFFATFSKEMNF